MSGPQDGGPRRDRAGAQGRDADAELTEAICGMLLESLRALADAGETEAACRLAGRACVRLRHARPALARRFDVLLHRLTPKLTWAQPPVPAPNADPGSPDGR